MFEADWKAHIRPHLLTCRDFSILNVDTLEHLNQKLVHVDAYQQIVTLNENLSFSTKLTLIGGILKQEKNNKSSAVRHVYLGTVYVVYASIKRINSRLNDGHGCGFYKMSYVFDLGLIIFSAARIVRYTYRNRRWDRSCPLSSIRFWRSDFNRQHKNRFCKPQHSQCLLLTPCDQFFILNHKNSLNARRNFKYHWDIDAKCCVHLTGSISPTNLKSRKIAVLC